MSQQENSHCMSKLTIYNDIYIYKIIKYYSILYDNK